MLCMSLLGVVLAVSLLGIKLGPMSFSDAIKSTAMRTLVSNS